VLLACTECCLFFFWRPRLFTPANRMSSPRYWKVNTDQALSCGHVHIQTCGTTVSAFGPWVTDLQIPCVYHKCPAQNDASQISRHSPRNRFLLILRVLETAKQVPARCNDIHVSETRVIEELQWALRSLALQVYFVVVDQPSPSSSYRYITGFKY
jgi:hypothetical protein